MDSEGNQRRFAASAYTVCAPFMVVISLSVFSDGFLAAYNVEGDFPVAPDVTALRITTLFFGHSTLTRGLVQWSVIGDGSAMSIMNKVGMVVYPLWMGVNAAAMAYVGSLGLDTSPLKFNLGLYVVCMAIGYGTAVAACVAVLENEGSGVRGRAVLWGAVSFMTSALSLEPRSARLFALSIACPSVVIRMWAEVQGAKKFSKKEN